MAQRKQNAHGVVHVERLLAVAVTAPSPARPGFDLRTRQQVAREILGPLQFLGTQAQMPCPHAGLHTKEDTKPSAKIFLDGSPTLTCWHSSCEAQLAVLNARLRAEIHAAECGLERKAGRPLPPAPKRPQLTAAQRRDYFAQVGSRALQAALKFYPLELMDLLEQSPVRPSENPPENFRLFMATLWRSDDRVWCGETFDSGKPHHAGCFRTAAEWLQLGKAPGPLTTPWTFKPGTCSRAREQALERRHLVLESDKLSQSEAASVYVWIRERLRLPLRAVVHSGGKSLHAWFAVPEPQLMEEMRQVLPFSGLDQKLFSATQPCRLAGWHRKDGQQLVQSLLYLDPGACR